MEVPTAAASAQVEQKTCAEPSTLPTSNGIVGARITDEQREKLEKYDALKETVTELLKEKEVLEQKVLEYVEKLEACKDSTSTIEKLNAEISALKAKLESSSSNESKMLSLEKELKALKDENTSHLVRISELTFENANLTCQLDELGKKVEAGGSVPNQKQYAPEQKASPGRLARPNVDAYNPYKNNGYGTW